MGAHPVQEAFESVRIVEANVSIGDEFLVPPQVSAWFVNFCVLDRRTGCGCGEGCSNRAMHYECEVETCPCGYQCTNRKFQIGFSVSAAVVDCGRKGVGLVAMEFFDADEYVGEYVGEVLTNTEATFQSRYYGRLAHYYMLRMSANQAIDATHFGGRMRFINHSCDPNCVFEKWNVCGQERCGVLLRAKCKEVRNLLSTITFTMSIVRYDDNKRICCGFI
ncbi:SET domain-containing protein [Phytophthora infestans]|uniref:SET domain-containing protein n=1 Tax=Phytophthora infestans TaxID=4787 RepID=A0A8S9UW89_PHYIN|nr:SET domain-containing protein [Phytophthora infestans]